MNNILLSETADFWPEGLKGLARSEFGSEDVDGIEIIEAYPLYASEREFVLANGADALWRLSWDRFDPLRPPVA